MTIFSLKDEKLRFRANVDGHFLTRPVDELFQKHELLTVPFMTGVNNDEGGWLLLDVSVNAELFTICDLIPYPFPDEPLYFKFYLPLLSFMPLQTGLREWIGSRL